MWVCPKCGNANRDEGRFCDNCAQARPDLLTLKRMVADGSPKDRIAEAIDMRSTADRKISTYWTALAALGFWASGGIYFLPLVSVLAYLLHLEFGTSINDLYGWVYIYSRDIAMVLFGAMFALLAYRLIVRLNEHCQREESLRASVMAYLRGPEPGSMNPEIVDRLISLSAYDGQAMIYEKRPNATRWAYGIGLALLFSGISSSILYWLESGSNFDIFDSYAWLFFTLSTISSVLSLASLIAMLALAGHLMKTIYTHDVRWTGFSNSAGIALRKSGVHFVEPDPRTVPKERSTLLYAVVTILTIGLFGFYWLYVLIDDPNKHFEDQARFEDALKVALNI